MKNKKGFVIPIIVAIVAVFAIGGGFYYNQKNKITTIPESLPDINFVEVNSDRKIDIATTTKNNIVGGDKDIHGCIGSAGYSWCEIKNKCLRVWEEKCEVINNENIAKDISSQEINLSWNISNIMSLNNIYDVEAETKIPTYSRYTVHPKNFFIDKKIMVDREGFFKFLLYSQNKEQRKIIVDKGLTLEENTRKGILNENISRDKEISYNNCEFFKKFYPDFGYKITGLCDDGNSFMFFSSQASTEEDAYSMIEEIMKAIKI